MPISRRIILLSLFPAALLFAACQQTGQSGSPEKRYDVKGKVISVRKAERRVELDHEPIRDAAGKNFMDAMKMEFTLRDEQALERLAPGDQVQATLVYNENTSLSWLEKVTIIKPGRP
jgi:Cu/Ag efflux protein CusF